MTSPTQKNNPIVPATLFLIAPKETYLAPRLLQTDAGTKNWIMVGIQCFIAGDLNGQRYGTSPSNQGIEYWWVVNNFKEMIDTGDLVLGSHTHMKCIWFVYSMFIQLDLDRIKNEWNGHYFRKSQHASVSGLANGMFFLPTSKGGVQYGKAVYENCVRNVRYQRYLCLQRDIFACNSCIQRSSIWPTTYVTNIEHGLHVSFWRVLKF